MYDPTRPDPTTRTTAAPSTTINTSAATTSSTTTTTTTQTSTTAIRQLELTHPDALPPEIDLRAETWVELLLVWQDIEDYWVWLYSHPAAEESIAARMFHPEGQELAEQLGALESLTDAGLRIISPVGVAGEVTAFTCCPDPDNQMSTGSIVIAMQTRLGEGAALFVDDSGETVSAVDGWTLSEWRLILRRTNNEEWTVWDLVSQ